MSDPTPTCKCGAELKTEEAQRAGVCVDCAFKRL